MRAVRATARAVTLLGLVACGASSGTTDDGGMDASGTSVGADSGPEGAGPTADSGIGSESGSGNDLGLGGDSGQGRDSGLRSGSSCTRPFFPPDAPWNQRADAMPVDAQSTAIIASLQAHGWGAGRMQIDTSMHVMCDAAHAAPKMAFTQTADFFSPDCDSAPVPIPPGGHIEGETGYNCTSNGDCHLIVIEPAEHRIYEQWRVDFTTGKYNGGCLAIWDTSAAPPVSGRGEGCTSADAGGFPIAALLFDADEVAAGHIDHAIRFILPNDIITRNTYVHPATHATNSTGGATAVPYGARLRLRGDRIAAVLAGLPRAAARVVAQAMHDYGIILSDGGNIALTSEDDQRTTAKWRTVMGTGLGTRDLQSILPSDFEMVDGGMRHDVSKTNCTHAPLTM